MNESFPNPEENTQAEKERTREEIISLGKELAETGETFPFPGIDEGYYKSLKKADEEYPGFTTPIDDLMQRFRAEGIKVMLSDTPGNKDVFILPAQSNDIGQDSILLRGLEVHEGVDERLKKLVSLSVSLYEA